jgi:MHS family proline/betaine transporter-like MFS transporter
MKTLKKQIALCTLGSLFEWYEFTVFASLTPIISILFFPHSNHFAAMMSTFAVLASGYVMRPLGALFFGHLGDTLGRKYTLLITIFLMAGATTAIGLIPTGYPFSTVALVIFRLAQGFATSGEYPGGLALLAEQNNHKHKSFIASFGIFSSGAGCFAGALGFAIIQHCVSNESMLQWGWRLPFLLGAPLGLIGYKLRKSILESPKFQEAKRAGLISHSPILQLLTQHYKTLIAVVFISILTNTLIAINFFYLGNYSLSIHKLTATHVTYLYLLITFIYALAILFFGWLADFFNKKRMIMTASLLIIAFSYPLFEIIIGASITTQFFAQTILSLLVGMVLGPFASLLAESFPTAVRYTGMSITLNVAASFFGGPAPMICGWLTSITGLATAPAFYVMGVALLALTASPFIATSAADNNRVAPSRERSLTITLGET